MGSRVFVLFELFLIVVFLYLVVNMVRYLFFKASRSGWGLELSDWWIRKDLDQIKKSNGGKKSGAAS